MGNLFSNQKNDLNELSELKQRLTTLENLDSNNDGVISQNEFKIWMDNQKRDLEYFKKSIQEKSNKKYRLQEKELIDYRNEIRELNKQIESLKEVNNNLNEQIIEEKQKTFDKIDELNDKKVIEISQLSSKRINDMIDELLKDKNINIAYFPDWVEKKLYRNFFTIAINLVDKILSESHIDFFGHTVSFNLEPKPYDEKN